MRLILSPLTGTAFNFAIGVYHNRCGRRTLGKPCKCHFCTKDAQP